MWLEKLIELKKKSGMSSEQIAKGTMMPKRTITRIFHGETHYPTIATLIPIVNFLGGSLDEIFADTGAVVGNKTLSELQEKIDVLTTERDSILSENAVLKDRVGNLTDELLKTQLAHKDEIIALYRLLYQTQTKGDS